MRTLRNWNGFLVRAILLLEFAGQALKGDDTAYFIAQSGLFGTIDLNTGAITTLGTTSTIPNYQIAGLGVIGSALYAAPYTGTTLYSVNPASGALNAIGSTSIQISALGSTITGLYALGNVGGAFSLYSVNPGTGATKLIGPLGQGLGPFYFQSLSTGSSTLYFADLENLYSINTTTGAATLIGGTSSQIPGALVYENGQLYAAASNPNAIYSISPTTGAATFVANPSGVSPSYLANDFAGLAPTAPPSQQNYVIAHLPFGAGWLSRVMIGAGSGGASVNVSFYSQAGGTATVPLKNQGGQSSQQFQLAANAVQVIAIDPTQRNAGPLQVDWALASSSGPLNVFTLFDYAPSNAPTTTPATQVETSVGAQSNAPAMSFRFPISVFGPLNYNAGLAIANPNSSTTTYTVMLLNADGSPRGSAPSSTLPANGQAIFLLTNVFSPSVLAQNSTNEFDGSVVLCASQPVGVVALGVEGGVQGTVLFYSLSTTNDYPCPL